MAVVYNANEATTDRIARCIQYELDHGGNSSAAASAILRDIRLGHISIADRVLNKKQELKPSDKRCPKCLDFLTAGQCLTCNYTEVDNTTLEQENERLKCEIYTSHYSWCSMTAHAPGIPGNGCGCRVVWARDDDTKNERITALEKICGELEAAICQHGIQDKYPELIAKARSFVYPHLKISDGKTNG